jgi:hypothetical protein
MRQPLDLPCIRSSDCIVACMYVMHRKSSCNRRLCPRGSCARARHTRGDGRSLRPTLRHLRHFEHEWMESFACISARLVVLPQGTIHNACSSEFWHVCNVTGENVLGLAAGTFEDAFRQHCCRDITIACFLASDSRGTPSSMFAAAAPGLQRERQRLVFQALQPVFSQLLDHTATSAQLADLFSNASQAMERDVLLRNHMHLCLDYLLFPFQFVLPAIASSRRTDAAQSPPGQGTKAVPGMASARAAEAALQCLQVMLANMSLQSAAQLRGLVTLLVDIVQLTPSEQTNEHMCLSTLAALHSAFSGAPVAAKELCTERGSWDVTLGYLTHSLLTVAEREQQSGGYGTTSDAAEVSWCTQL